MLIDKTHEHVHLFCFGRHFSACAVGIMDLFIEVLRYWFLCKTAHICFVLLTWFIRGVSHMIVTSLVHIGGLVVVMLVSIASSFCHLGSTVSTACIKYLLTVTRAALIMTRAALSEAGHASL